MSRVIPITGALVAATLAVAPAGSAQVTSSQDSAWSPWYTGGRGPGSGNGAMADSAWIRQAIHSNFTEAGLGRLADSRAENEQVKDFAERMVSDHNELNRKWADLAKDNDMEVGIEFGDDGRQAIDRLEDLDDAEFDQAYMGEMIRRHEQDLAAFQRMATSARSSEVRALATSSSTSVREHLALARQVGSGVGVATTAGRAGGVVTPTPLPAPSDDARRRTTTATTTTTDRTTGDARDDDDRDERDARDDRNRPPLRAEDRVFVEGTLSDHLMQIRLAKRAQREGRSEETRDFAERIEKDFTKWADRWESFADRRNTNVTSHLERQHREKLQRLEKASERKDYDRAYAAIVSEHLQRLIEGFRDERREDGPAAVRRLVEGELPMLRENLARARRLEQQASQRKEDADKK
jgi:putative membrane protein